jgi:hypothetical protein
MPCIGIGGEFDGNGRDGGDIGGSGNLLASTDETGVLGMLFLWQIFSETQSSSLAFIALP